MQGPHYHGDVYVLDDEINIWELCDSSRIADGFFLSGLRDSCDDDTCQELVDARCALEYGEVLKLHGSQAGK